MRKEDDDVSEQRDITDVDFTANTGLINTSEQTTDAFFKGSSYRYCMPTHAVFTSPVPTARIVDKQFV